MIRNRKFLMKTLPKKTVFEKVVSIRVIKYSLYFLKKLKLWFNWGRKFRKKKSFFFYIYHSFEILKTFSIFLKIKKIFILDSIKKLFLLNSSVNPLLLHYTFWKKNTPISLFLLNTSFFKKNSRLVLSWGKKYYALKNLKVNSSFLFNLLFFLNLNWALNLYKILILLSLFCF